MRQKFLFLALFGASGIALILGAQFFSYSKDVDSPTSVLPTSYDIAQVERELSGACPSHLWSCWAKALRGATATYGPAAAIEAVEYLKAKNSILSSVDEHQLSHEIGRETARIFGISPEAFLACPMSAFNGGCQHGYFEHVLGESVSAQDAASAICESLGEEYSSKFRFYCYHGVGHGVMMAQAYDLYASLEVCDRLEAPMAQDGCWQGVFMENANAAMRGEARSGLFSVADPLAPCNAIAERYRHECFLNHAGWLMAVFQNDVKAASAACLNAPDTLSRTACFETIGLMVTNPVWQQALAKDIEANSFEDVAWKLCEKFPDNAIVSCVIGGLDNIMNFDEFDTSRAQRFCDAVDVMLRERCYERIGVALRNQATEPTVVRERCMSFQSSMQTSCLHGAGL